MNVLSDVVVIKIVFVFVDLRKEINDLLSGFRQIFKYSDSMGISVGIDDDVVGFKFNIVKISSDNNEVKDGKDVNY